MPDAVEKWDFFEVTLNAQFAGNPFLDVSLEAEFIHAHRSIKVRGFYDGGDTYRVRFMPDAEGEWRYATHSNVDALNGCTGEAASGPVEVELPRKNYLAIRVVRNGS